MRKYIFMLLSVAMILCLDVSAEAQTTAAGDAKAKQVKKCLFPKSRKRAPDWVCNAQVDSLTVSAVGSFHKSGAGIAFIEQMAAADARVHLANKLRASMQKRIAQSDAAANNDNALINKITDEQLKGSRVLKSVYGPKGRLYVLMGFDEAGAQKLQEAVAADYLVQKR